jgi:hypothetical protein
MTALLLLALAAADRPLTTRFIDRVPPVPADVIVGRAACDRTTWLLTERRDLVQIAHEPVAVTKAVARLQASDQPWGLACLSDGSLWTLGLPRVLARLHADGRAGERIPLQRSRMLLYGWSDRLLSLSMPVVVAQPVLATSRPSAPDTTSPWPAFVARATAVRSNFFAHNLVACGIAWARALPCWFADERQIGISDGSSVRAISFPFLYDRNVDQAIPIWDVAIGGPDTLWLLAGATGAVGGRKGGGRLINTTKDGTTRRSIAVSPPARTIVAATEVRCLLLTIDGRLMEVTTE